MLVQTAWASPFPYDSLCPGDMVKIKFDCTGFDKREFYHLIVVEQVDIDVNGDYVGRGLNCFVLEKNNFQAFNFSWFYAESAYSKSYKDVLFIEKV